MTQNDLQWPSMTFNDLRWPKMAWNKHCILFIAWDLRDCLDPFYTFLHLFYTLFRLFRLKTSFFRLETLFTPFLHPVYTRFTPCLDSVYTLFKLNIGLKHFFSTIRSLQHYLSTILSLQHFFYNIRRLEHLFWGNVAKSRGICCFYGTFFHKPKATTVKTQNRHFRPKIRSHQYAKMTEND